MTDTRTMSDAVAEERAKYDAAWDDLIAALGPIVGPVVEALIAAITWVRERLGL